MTHTESLTIPECLGLRREWADEITETCMNAWSAHDTVSGTIEDVAKSVQREHFDTSVPLTEYEMKLIFAGVCIGQTKGKLDLVSKMPEPLKILVASFLKK
jgi:hypothetical protein